MGPTFLHPSLSSHYLIRRDTAKGEEGNNLLASPFFLPFNASLLFSSLSSTLYSFSFTQTIFNLFLLLFYSRTTPLLHHPNPIKTLTRYPKNSSTKFSCSKTKLSN